MKYGTDNDKKFLPKRNKLNNNETIPLMSLVINFRGKMFLHFKYFQINFFNNYFYFPPSKNKLNLFIFIKHYYQNIQFYYY